MEQCTVRDAAVKLAEWFAIGGGGAKRTPEAKAAPAERGEDRTENKPLKFQLKNIDPEHPYLAERGISKETAETFGIGFFSGRGSMSGRVVIPIHNGRGELVAYAGRAVDGSEPKYKLPAGFHKSLELFNLHRINPLEETVCVVEGFFDCMKVHEAGFACVAIMGSSLSNEQEVLLCRYFVKVILLFDGDAAGNAGTDDCLLRLGRKIWVKAIQLQDGVQPDSLSVDELQQRLSL